MTRTITISDDVYRMLESEKGDKSFSDVIRERLENNRRLADVAGARVLGPETQKAVTDDIEQMSRGTSICIDDETS